MQFNYPEQLGLLPLQTPAPWMDLQDEHRQDEHMEDENLQDERAGTILCTWYSACIYHLIEFPYFDHYLLNQSSTADIW
jgi:hypothetical protein